MFWQRKSRNRRHERTHVLDVKMHSKHLRAVRLRKFSRALAWSLGTLLTVLIVWRGCEWVLDEFVYRNPTFAVQEIQVQTDGIVPDDQLRAWTGVSRGANLFLLDVLRVKRDLELNPIIQHASVDRVLPNILSVRVTEREPIAQMTAWQSGADGRLRPVRFYFDDQGFVLAASDVPNAPGETGMPFEHLPRLTGVDVSEVTRGRCTQSPGLRAALKLIVAFGTSPMAGLADLQELDLSTRPTIEITTTEGSKVVFAFEGIELQLRRWRLVYDHALSQAKAIAALDLSVANNVPARWQEASLVPPAAPRPSKPSPYRKKHV